MKAVVIILSIIAFAVCLIVGIQAGSQSTHASSASATDTPNPWISPSTQRTILVIVADNLSNPAPGLEAVWLALYRPDLPKLTLLPLFPESPSTTTANPPDLAAAFTLDKNHKPSAGFYQALSRFHVQWNGFLLTDLAAVSQSIDWMQGIELGGSQVTGPAALASLTSPSMDRTAALSSQKALLGAVCQRSGHLPLEANWIGLANTFSGSHLQTNIPVETLVADWKAMMSASTPFACDLPIP
jgi:hypothetical protein